MVSVWIAWTLVRIYGQVVTGMMITGGIMSYEIGIVVVGSNMANQLGTSASWAAGKSVV